MSSRWTVGPDEALVIEATEGGPITVGPFSLDADAVQDLRMKLALAITVAYGDTTT